MIAPDTAEAVWQAGGWLFDRAMAGWDVTVVTHRSLDARPLRILGVRARDLNTLLAETMLADRVPGPCLRAVAVRTDLYEADPRVPRMVLAAAVGGGEIRLWGEGWPRDFEETADTVSHRLSMAARAFKTQALRAPGVTAPAESAEVFRLAVALAAIEYGVIGVGICGRLPAINSATVIIRTRGNACPFTGTRSPRQRDGGVRGRGEQLPAR